MEGKRALIVGGSGQDGAWLGKLLAGKGYRVEATSRSDPQAAAANLRRIEAAGAVHFHRLDPADGPALARLVANSRPEEIYCLAAQSSVGRSFDDPATTVAASVASLLNLLEAVRAEAPDARVFHAASGDCFGVTSFERPADEASPFAPRSPYAAAKCASHQLLQAWRTAWGMFACSGFLFSHESFLRPERFVIGKVAAAVRRIAAGSDERLQLGDIAVIRDWGWAPEYAEAMWRMLQLDEPMDLVIATGRSVPLSYLVDQCFAAAGLDWRDHVDAGAAPPRPADIPEQHADPRRALEAIGWQAQVGVEELARKLVSGQG